ncbi:MAG TPA: polymer-forming cytoskeletal protein [Polyangia bacterium]|jgi:cytoskeletal protein CcmA (bactofilin family)|nr:polymer-forming cytoskeletal protein [Polyangia bacterium]
MAKGENGKSATTTAIGPTIIIKGKLRSDEDLIVKGRIEAEISSSKALLVENSGIIKANIRVKSARISGVLVGNVTAEELVEIAPDGRMVGDLTAPKIIINDGAAFRGRIDMQNFDEAPEPKPKANKTEASAPAKLPESGGDHPPAAAAK